MISFAALAIYLTAMVIIMYQSVIVATDGKMAILEAVILVAIVSGIPALLGMLNGMNIKKHNRRN